MIDEFCKEKNISIQYKYRDVEGSQKGKICEIHLNNEKTIIAIGINEEAARKFAITNLCDSITKKVRISIITLSAQPA